jgi:glucose/arabinose dehydrogenase
VSLARRHGHATRTHVGAPRPRRLGRVAAAAALAACLTACGSPAAAPTREPADTQGLTLEVVASGLSRPVDVAVPPGDRRLYIVEQTGAVRVLDGGRLRPMPFLDLSGEVSCCSERGLLGIAFHPRFRENRHVFLNYTNRDGDTVIERWTATADGNLAIPGSRRVLLEIDQPYSNHNGGCLRFGPDGMLWIGMGDGGSGGDPQRRAQNLGSLLGKMLRIDVDGGSPYGIPPDNPHRDRRGARPEIWAHGLRNPWRYTFDGPHLYIADVGQWEWEEIDVAPWRQAGVDYGWNLLEGDACFRSPECLTSKSLRPVLVYPHQEGCSVTGGEVYRGRRTPRLAGHYFFADYCHRWIRSFRWDGGAVTDYREWRNARVEASGFGVDADGELLVLDHGGRVLRLVFAAR